MVLRILDGDDIGRPIPGVKEVGLEKWLPAFARMAIDVLVRSRSCEGESVGPNPNNVTWAISKGIGACAMRLTIAHVSFVHDEWISTTHVVQ